MLLKLYDKNNNPHDLQRIVDLLQEGGLLIYPTDTTYAIGCHALKERAVERICRIKGIDPGKNRLAIICYDLSNIPYTSSYTNSAGEQVEDQLQIALTIVDPTTGYVVAMVGGAGVKQ